uniref:Uncharacterized protein n=1 Tax=Solanum lycopersicum TaxID=4081 RepID=A0A3Q7H8N6_SOLLC
IRGMMFFQLLTSATMMNHT